jgi:prepilin-type N-terminal cleavage/methylation domain-containing protein
MTFSKLKTMKKDRGFTIVELLIVIVVIAILAAIVIVAYNGVQKRANASTAKSNAESVQKVAEAYAADTSAGNGTYTSAATLSSWSGGITRIPSGVTVNSLTLTATQADGKTIQYLPNSGGTGGCIAYWDASLTTPAAVYVYAGAATTGVNAATPTCA